jgi:two-component system OmpR family response regulator/two-component system response regulator QseB
VEYAAAYAGGTDDSTRLQLAGGPSGFQAGSGALERSGMRILVVEDDPGIGELVSEDLKDKGFAVDWAQDGDEAMSLLDSYAYDLLILDLVIPGVSGLDITRTLRAHKRTVPIIMITARDTVEDRVRGLEVGADDYLVKPFHLKELRARVLALLRRAGGEGSNQLTIGRITLDIAQKRTWFCGSEVLLSRTEYNLLEFLAFNPKRVFSRGELLEHAWPAEAAVDLRSIDTYIGFLRRKLASDVIETRRGFGYRFRG